MQDEPTAPIPPTASEGTGPTPAPPGPPPPAAPPPAWVPPPSPPPAAAKPRRITAIVGHRLAGWIVAALLVGAVTGLSVALATTSSAPVASRTPITVQPPTYQIPSRAPNAFRVPVPFGRAGNVVEGKVNSISASSFTITTTNGSVVTVDEQSATVYRSAGATTTKASVKKGDEVFVFGSRSGSTVKALAVFIGRFGPATYFFPG